MIDLSNASRETLSRVLATCPPHYRPIIAAVRDMGVGYALVLQDAGPCALPLKIGQPAIIVLGDDLHSAKGPTAFDAASVERAVRKCEAAFIVASAAKECVAGARGGMETADDPDGG